MFQRESSRVLAGCLDVCNLKNESVMCRSAILVSKCRENSELKVSQWRIGWFGFDDDDDMGLLKKTETSDLTASAAKS